jgi:hypothetical protein
MTKPITVVSSGPLSSANRRLLESCLKGLAWKVVEATTWKPDGSHVLVLGQKAHDLLSAIPYRSAEGHRWRGGKTRP